MIEDSRIDCFQSEKPYEDLADRSRKYLPTLTHYPSHSIFHNVNSRADGVLFHCLNPNQKIRS